MLKEDSEEVRIALLQCGWVLVREERTKEGFRERKKREIGTSSEEQRQEREKSEGLRICWCSLLR